MNEFEQKQADRKARYLERAGVSQEQASAAYSEARRRGQAIPFGQPILIGHHSESRDRNYRAGIHRLYGKSFALQEKAEHYQRKAEAVGRGGISSDDPDALEKLRAELAGVNASQTMMKAANKAIRSHSTPEARHAALIAAGLTEAQAVEALKPDFMGRVGFPSYALSNNRANGKRIEDRIRDLEARRAATDVEIAGEGYVYREDVADNRVHLIFEGKPDEATRKLLTRNGFRWSPSRVAWVRQLNNAGKWAAKTVRATLDAAAKA